MVFVVWDSSDQREVDYPILTGPTNGLSSCPNPLFRAIAGDWYTLVPTSKEVMPIDYPCPNNPDIQKGGELCTRPHMKKTAWPNEPTKT
jgi:hypothetical protein